MIQRLWVQIPLGLFLTKFILCCVTSDNLIEMHKPGLSWKTRMSLILWNFCKIVSQQQWTLLSGHTELTDFLSDSDFLTDNYGFIVKCRKCPHCSKTETETNVPSDLNGFQSHFCFRYRTEWYVEKMGFWCIQPAILYVSLFLWNKCHLLCNKNACFE